jgi:short-subunit dehydrogenase
MILITGATDGIGLALARRYEASGVRTILIGRRALGDAPPPASAESYCRVDLARPDAADRVAAFLDARGVDRLDALVHNAAIGYYGPIAEQSPESVRALVAVNLIAPMALTRALLPRVERAAGAIAFISSVVSVIPSPDYAVYAATKAALDDFARNLRVELRDSPARVLLIHPGAVRTAMHAKIGMKVDPRRAAKWPSPDEAAERIARAIAGGRESLVFGAGNAMARAVARLAPGLLDRAVRRRAR